ncbi:MAG: hypothetical protein QOI18_1481, partial [Solirubrobacteraceae bacterium]|nr:hypothetical protein [Solirubrobacteraceae bacterium]
MMSDEQTTSDEYQWHTSDLDLSGDPAEGDWS